MLYLFSLLQLLNIKFNVEADIELHDYAIFTFKKYFWKHSNFLCCMNERKWVYVKENFTFNVIQKKKKNR